ncbi:hypothetical protein AVEN_171418-1 [Araneus ventricosus]|uniref:RNase H type-1 domain-containing protein n=1 Tax=Araneus ventricosus TaxID=182803 RepID=A0A4Y2D2H9_ARAVE|nr:hypothetical protein AVEN_171418-1 [Araneus ventricosus]
MYACHFQCLALSLENDIFTEICYLLNCDDKSFGVIGRRGIKTLSLLPISVITVAFTTFVPRATLGVKARQICPAKVSRHRSQVRLLPFGCSLKRSCTTTLNEISGVDIQIYTDGSKNEENQSGSGIYIKTPREVRKIKLRNPDNCSVFRSELLAIEAGLEVILNENNYGAVWILSDSRSSIQHQKDWNNVGDRTGISILKLLRHIGVDHEVHLQWIPSHVDIYGNEKNKDLKTWRVPPSHDWYKRSSPGGSICLACDRADQTALSRFVSGHLRSCSFSHGNKVFPVCAKCGVASASPEHILSCLRLSRETFEADPLLALDFLRVSGLMDGV